MKGNGGMELFTTNFKNVDYGGKNLFYQLKSKVNAPIMGQMGASPLGAKL